MSNKMKRMLVLLLIILTANGQWTAQDCGNSCSLNYCYCSFRGLSRVPQDLPTNITHLELWQNAITNLSQSDFSGYRSLISLDVGYNQISMIHNKTFHNLSNLTRLSLTSNQLTTLPADVFAGLVNLQDLHLDQSKLSSLPVDIFVGLGNLWQLFIASNELTTVPSGIFAGLDNLQHLSLSYNKLASLPADIFVGLVSLQYLFLQDNQLKYLSAGIFVGLGNLQSLDLDQNGLKSLPAGIFVGLSNLQSLTLGQNRLKSLPADIFAGLGNLQSLNLDGNYLASLPAGNFSGLAAAHLQQSRLVISRNQLSSFPADIIAGYGNIQQLLLQQNLLQTLPPVAYDLLASIPTVIINDNPWQCDCRIAPFRQRMTGSYPFEDQIRCAGPDNLTGQYLRDVGPIDLVCEKTTPGYPINTGDEITLPVSLFATMCVFLGLFIICAIALTLWCMYKYKRNKNVTGTSSGNNRIMLHKVTNADINSQSEMTHSGTEESHLIHNLPTDDPEYEPIGEISQTENQGAENMQGLRSSDHSGLPIPLTPENPTGPQADVHDESGDAAGRTVGSGDTRTDWYENDEVLSPSQRPQPGSGQTQHLSNFSDDYEVPSPSLDPQPHEYENSQVIAASQDAEAGSQVIENENDDDSVFNQSQTAAATGADSPNHYEPLRNPNGHQQHIYTPLLPRDLQQH